MHEQQLADLRQCLATAPSPRGRPKSAAELNYDDIRESAAEERDWDRRNRPLSRAEWARAEEGDL